MRSGAPGTDGIQAEMLRALDFELRAGFAASMRATVVGDAVPPDSWKRDIVIPILKDRVAAPRASNLRYLRQGALSQKLAARSLRDRWRPVCPWFLGGFPRCRTADVAEVLRAAAQLSATWSDPRLHAVLATGDVFRAYDSVPLAATMETLGAQSAEERIVYGTPLLQGRVEGAAADAPLTLEPTIGVRTGAVESNQLLAQVLHRTLAHLPARWAANGWLFFDPAVGPSIFAWVDNIYLAATSHDAATDMMADIGEALQTQGLRLKPTSLQIMQCGRRGPVVQGAVPLPARAGLGPTGDALTLQRVSAMPVLGFHVQMDGRARDELDFHLRRADRAWFSLRRLATSKWVPSRARQHLLSSRVWTIAIPPGAGAWALDKADVQALRQWELGKVSQAHRLRHPRSCQDIGAAFRRLEALAARAALEAATDRLVDRYFGAVYDRAAAWADNRNCCQALWRWACQAGDEVGWQTLAPAFQRLDPRNSRSWRHSAPGRPRLTWAALVSELTEGSWTVAIGGPLPSRGQFIARGREWAGIPAHVAQVPAAPGAQVARPAPALPWPKAPVQPVTTGRRVQMFTDARGLAEAACGQATAPQLAQATLRAALESLWRLRVDGDATWILHEPLCWISRELNGAADFLATCDLSEGEHFWRTTQGDQQSALRVAFSDGASSDAAQGWAAFVASRTVQGWRVTAAHAWRGPPATHTVPVLEAAGIAAAAKLLEAPSAEPALLHRLPSATISQVQQLLSAAWPIEWPCAP